MIWYFYPRSPCGERPLYLDTVSALASFLSTLSLRRATSSSGPFQGDQLLFYPRSPCGERRYGTSLDCNRVYFSIHALLAESDGPERPGQNCQSISIHALLAESDELVWCSSGGAFAFLSTLSLRRATGASHASSQSRRHFYPRSPCGERRYPSGDCRLRAAYFYPRSPCGERQEHINRRTDNRNFYPRSPCGERQSMQDRPEEK